MNMCFDVTYTILLLCGGRQITRAGLKKVYGSQKWPIEGPCSGSVNNYF